MRAFVVFRAKCCDGCSNIGSFFISQTRLGWIASVIALSSVVLKATGLEGADERLLSWVQVCLLPMLALPCGNLNHLCVCEGAQQGWERTGSSWKVLIAFISQGLIAHWTAATYPASSLRLCVGFDLYQSCSMGV